jgi:hypothetical protein
MSLAQFQKKMLGLGYEFDNFCGVKRCAERIVRLYEQGADLVRIGEYVLRWVRWLKAGIDRLDTVMAVFPPLRDLILGWRARPGYDRPAGCSLLIMVLMIQRVLLSLHW